MKYFKRIAGIALSAAVVLTSMTTLAAGNITWQVKDYVTTTGVSGTVGNGLGTGQGGPALVGPYEIVYEQYLDGVATGYVIKGDQARDYGLKGWASSITRPVNWYDVTYPNLQYEEIWADGQYTGLVWPTGARLPYTAYKDFPYMWEVGGTHKIVAETRANFGGTYIGNANGGANYPSVYTGVNADVKEENRYFGFDVFEIYEDGKARDVEVVLDTEGNGVNATNAIKANHMLNAANTNTIKDGNITGLVNSGNGVDSKFYDKLTNDQNLIVAYRSNTELNGVEHKVPVFDYTYRPSTDFDDLLDVTHYFHLAGPVFENDGTIAAGNEYALQFNAYRDVVTANDKEIDELHEIALWNDDETGDWDYTVDATRYSFYTNNIITTAPNTYKVGFPEPVKATANWVYAGYELAEPYRMFEYLNIEGITFDGDIDNDGNFDTPVIFRYMLNTNGTVALANPKVEWEYAWVDATYPNEIIMQKFVEDMNGNMVATNDYRGSGKYAKVNIAAEINPTPGVESVAKHVQARLEWRANDGTLYVTPYFNINDHVGEYVELSSSADPDYIGAYDFVVPGAPVFLDPATIESLN